MDTFATALAARGSGVAGEGDQGTLVLAGMVPALTGEILTMGADHLVIETKDGAVCVVPFTAVLYWRAADYDGPPA